jgi:hypothetical protein
VVADGRVDDQKKDWVLQGLAVAMGDASFFKADRREALVL